MALTYLVHVFRAVVMESLDALHLVSLCVTCRPYHVMNATSRILGQCQDGLPACAIQLVAFGRGDAAKDRP